MKKYFTGSSCEIEMHLMEPQQQPSTSAGALVEENVENVDSWDTLTELMPRESKTPKKSFMPSFDSKRDQRVRTPEYSLKKKIPLEEIRKIELDFQRRSLVRVQGQRSLFPASSDEDLNVAPITPKNGNLSPIHNAISVETTAVKSPKTPNYGKREKIKRNPIKNATKCGKAKYARKGDKSVAVKKIYKLSNGQLLKQTPDGKAKKRVEAKRAYKDTSESNAIPRKIRTRSVSVALALGDN